jgi:hypothetical protein
MKVRRIGVHGWRAAALGATVIVAVTACSGGGSGAPRSLSLSGEQVPISQVTTAYSQMCTISTQAQSNPAATAAPFANAEGGLNVEATVLAKDHGQESQRLLAALSTFQADIIANPPPSTSGQAAANLLATAKQGLQALKISPPNC